MISGGHDIPIEIIRRRYFSGIRNLSKLYLPICDYWVIIDNSIAPYNVIAEGSKDYNIDIYNQDIYNKIVKP